MNGELFPEVKKEFHLFDAQRRRIILTRLLAAEDAAASNRHLIDSLCPHLRYVPGDQITVRNYTIDTPRLRKNGDSSDTL